MRIDTSFIFKMVLSEGNDKMGYRYEYDEVDVDLYHLLETLTGEDQTAIRCTIYDDETDEELASGLGNDKYEARRNAEDDL